MNVAPLELTMRLTMGPFGTSSVAQHPVSFNGQASSPEDSTAQDMEVGAISGVAAPTVDIQQHMERLGKGKWHIHSSSVQPPSLWLEARSLGLLCRSC